VLIVIPCGNKKRPYPARARDLYIGPYFAKHLAVAEALARGEANVDGTPRVLIASARHGLVPPDEVVAPYNLHLATLTVPERDALEGRMRAQADALGLTHASPVWVFGGDAYVRLVGGVWHYAARVTPPGLAIGLQMQWLTHLDVDALRARLIATGEGMER
jgi:hypothetical protein